MTMIWVTIKQKAERVIALKFYMDKIEIICGAALELFPTFTIKIYLEMCLIYVRKLW